MNALIVVGHYDPQSLTVLSSTLLEDSEGPAAALLLPAARQLGEQLFSTPPLRGIQRPG